MPTPEPDADLELNQAMQAYQAGRREAFDDLFRALSQPLYQYLLSRLMDASRAEDLVQETFLQIHRARSTYQPGRSVRAWAFGVARHVFLMDRRRQARRYRREVPGEEVLEQVPVPPLDDSIHDQHLIRQAMAELTSDQREVLLLHHEWGFTFREIAAILGIRSVTAKLRAFRAGRLLRSSIDARSVTGSAKGANKIVEKGE